MSNTPLDPTVPSPNPNDNPEAEIPPVPKEVWLGLPVVIDDDGGNGDGANSNGCDGNHDDECAQYLEELVQRLGDLDALAYCALFLLGEIPRDPSPSAEAPMRRLWRIVERIASEINDGLRFANAAVAFVRGSHRKRGGNDDDGSNGGEVQP